MYLANFATDKIHFMYSETLVRPMIDELVAVGFKELKTGKEVTDFISDNEVALIVVNSVCGCAAGNARPAVKMAIKDKKDSLALATVFAGFNLEATDAARNLMAPYPPSSPSIALFKKGKLVHMIERHHIEGNHAATIAENLAAALE